MRWLDQDFLDKAELNDSLGIKYDKATDGWTLINPPEVGGDLGCHHNNHNCLKVVNEILGKLESRTKLKLLNKKVQKLIKRKFIKFSFFVDFNNMDSLAVHPNHHQHHHRQGFLHVGLRQ